MSKVEMVIDSVNVALIDYRRSVILKEKDGERYLPMWVGAYEADAIVTGLSKASAPGSLTHDFICSIIKSLGAILKYVVVHELKGEIYHAKAYLETAGKPVEIDCRPSDAFAIAIKAGAAIFVAEDILTKSGIRLSELRKLENEKEER